jgi:hypothetical protein
MTYHIVEPEVAGGWGENTVADSSTHPPRVSKLHYRFDGWLGDAILESFPCYIATEEAKRKIETIGATGVQFADVEVSVSEQFKDLYGDRQIPKFRWLQILGKAGQDDFGILPAPDLRLVISDRILEALRQLGISHATIQPFKAPPS